MYISTYSLVKMTLCAFFFGIALAALYDVVRITRVIIGVGYGENAHHGHSPADHLRNAYVFATDLVFFTVAGAAFSVFIYYTDSGIFRWQALAALLLGFFSYYKTIGTLVIAFSGALSVAVKKFVKKSAKTIAIPIMFMYNIIVKVSKKLFEHSIGVIITICKQYRTKRMVKRLISEAVADAKDIFIERTWENA